MILSRFQSNEKQIGTLVLAVKAELLKLNRTQFSSLGIFISKKAGNQKN